MDSGQHAAKVAAGAREARLAALGPPEPAPEPEPQATSLGDEIGDGASFLVEQTPTHMYADSSFRLFGVPMPRASQVLGLVGSNGVGKR